MDSYKYWLSYFNKKQGEKVGANYILLAISYSSTQHISGTMVMPQVSTTYINTQSTTNAFGSGGYGTAYSRGSGTATTYSNQYIPYSRSVDYYDQEVQYFYCP